MQAETGGQTDRFPDTPGTTAKSTREGETITQQAADTGAKVSPASDSSAVDKSAASSFPSSSSSSSEGRPEDIWNKIPKVGVYKRLRKEVQETPVWTLNDVPHSPSFDGMGVLFEPSVSKEAGKLAGGNSAYLISGLFIILERWIWEDRPLNQLLRPFDKNKQPLPFIWTAAADEAFLELRNHLTELPILSFSDMHTLFIVKPDACNISIGSVLLQIKDRRESVITYASRGLQRAELNYGAPEQEALTNVFCCRQWQHYLFGSSIF
uniref:Reverse transcriptase/retrotransposon-derived protein RNase H-like domain-containing protein n=1 Tax=Chromera velia CCMP2878 TaxID=1169474 RepID=A0A0G4HI34_9ALVE|eukprot:Cvel_6910.t1-p1 / transcript=Cvel_6910.t1 / gene=Cvel_6910 / organism=Chromera_velia_CCMP2878 / gene_product=Retrovirus-related Pol polyprotein from transposon, putative / transcript_product=Retrovirus-related Pol polyprotein from transposon, putative / location=Cvel_scaffold349:72186-72980(-) / protein_length=265 / sequence_SO=supercontig / SO=protein_coding / is_pseudo=false